YDCRVLSGGSGGTTSGEVVLGGSSTSTVRTRSSAVFESSIVAQGNVEVRLCACDLGCWA
ncbi:MAG: hypothetical protein ACK41O_27595, partial [Runella zeae]